MKYLAYFFIGISLLVSCSPQQKQPISEEDDSKFVFPMGNDTLNIVDIQIKSEYIATIRCTSKLDKDKLLDFVFDETKREYGVYSFWIDGDTECYAEYRNSNDSTAYLYMYDTGHTYVLNIDKKGNHTIKEDHKY